jgi:hypothetical protein
MHDYIQGMQWIELAARSGEEKYIRLRDHVFAAMPKDMVREVKHSLMLLKDARKI